MAKPQLSKLWPHMSTTFFFISPIHVHVHVMLIQKRLFWGQLNVSYFSCNVHVNNTMHTTVHQGTIHTQYNIYIDTHALGSCAQVAAVTSLAGK